MSRININISTHIGLTRIEYALHIAFSKLTSCTDKELIKALAISYAVIKMLNNINMYKFISSNKNYLYAQAGGSINNMLLEEIKRRNLQDKYFITVDFSKYN